EHAGVEQLVLRRAPATPPVLLQEIPIRKGGLRILVEVLHVGMGRRGVEVEVALLDVLAVIALRPGEAEQPLLQDGIAPVPERPREAEALVVVRDARDTVLAPAIGPRARVVVRQILPGDRE